MGDLKNFVERMHFYPALKTTALLVSALVVASAQPTLSPTADSPESLRDLCHTIDLCWLMVLTPGRDGAFIVEAKFPNDKRFVRPEDPYCDRREYWHVAGAARNMTSTASSLNLGPFCTAEHWLAGRTRRPPHRVAHGEIHHPRCQGGEHQVDPEEVQREEGERQAGERRSEHHQELARIAGE